MKLRFNHRFSESFNQYVKHSSPLVYSVTADSLSNYLIDIGDVSIAEWALHILIDPEMINGDISLCIWGGEIIENYVWLEYMYFDPETTKTDDTSSFSCRVCISRQEMIYAVSKWRDFLQHPVDHYYQEIIDTNNYAIDIVV